MLLPRRADAYLSSSSCTCFPISNGQRGTAITSPSRSLALSISLYFVFRCGLIKTASSLPLDTALFASSDHKAPYLRKMPAPLGSHQRYPRDLLPAPGETFTGWVEIKRLCLSQLGVPNLSPPLGAPRLGAPSRPLAFLRLPRGSLRTRAVHGLRVCLVFSSGLQEGRTRRRPLPASTSTPSRRPYHPHVLA